MISKLMIFILGNNLFQSLRQSELDLTATNLISMQKDNRFKSVILCNVLQLLALSEYLRSLPGDRETLLIFESLQSLFYACKVSFIIKYFVKNETCFIIILLLV